MPTHHSSSVEHDTLTSVSEGNPTRLQVLQADYQEEYEALTNDEKDELIIEFNAHKEEGAKVRRPTARARIQDVANVARNMQLLVSTSIKKILSEVNANVVDDGLNISCWS